MEWECDALKTFFCWRCIACQAKVPLEWRNKKKKMLKQSNHSSSDSRYSLFVIVINFPFHISSRIQRFVLALQHQYQWRLQISWHIIIFLQFLLLLVRMRRSSRLKVIFFRYSTRECTFPLQTIREQEQEREHLDLWRVLKYSKEILVLEPEQGSERSCLEPANNPSNRNATSLITWHRDYKQYYVFYLFRHSFSQSSAIPWHSFHS